MKPREGELDQRCKAYQLARERAEKLVQIESLKCEAWSLIEKLDCLMSEWTGVDSKNRSDEYHESKRSIDNQLYYLRKEIQRLSGPDLQIISELCGLRRSFLRTQLNSLMVKKRPAKSESRSKAYDPHSWREGWYERETE